MQTNIALIAASAVLVGTCLMPWLSSSWPMWARAGWRFVDFAILTSLVVWALGSPFAPNLNANRADVRLWEQLVEIGWWLVAAQCAVGIVALFLIFEEKPRETRIVSDLLGGLIHLLAFFAIINFVFAVPIGGLLATSGVIAIVLGLALQSSLADLFSGIAVGIERPYAAGDLVSVEGGVEGQVVQVNWRSTHIATANGDVAIVPNSVMAKSRLVNHSIPNTSRGVTVNVRLAANERPDKCVSTLNAALKTCMLMSETPLPYIARTAINGDGVVYEIGFTVPDITAFEPARTELLGQIQTHLRHEGLAMGVTGIAKPDRPEKPTAQMLLEESEWFGALGADDQSCLAEHLVKVRYAVGDHLIREGKEPEALFLVASGAVEISVTNGDNKRVIHRLGPGTSLGAIALIMDSSYGATATALTPVTTYCLDRKAMKDAIALRPELVKSLETIAKQGQLTQTIDVTAHPSARMQTPEMFLPRLREFFRKITETQHV